MVRVDEELHGHPGVKRSATIRVPDPKRPGSERVKAYVEPEPDYDGDLAPGDVVEYLDGRVARHAVPAEVEVVGNVPQTDIGKTDEKALRERNDADGGTAE